MHTLYRSPQPNKTRRYRQTPVNTGVLIDLYLSHQKLVVIDNYLSSYSTTGEEKERLLELRIEIFNNSRFAAEIFQSLKLPRWSRLPEDLRQIFNMAAVGRMENSFAVSCNLGPISASRARKASRGTADYIGRKIRGLPEVSSEIAAVLEDAADRQGCNPGLHFHAALRIHPDQAPALRASLKLIFAPDYVEVAGNQAVFLKPIDHPGRWASYCCKTLGRENQISGKTRFATNSASRAGEELYDEVMYWLRHLPSVVALEASLDDLIRPNVSSPSCPRLLRIIDQHRVYRKDIQRKRGQQTRLYKRLAKQSPDQFRLELVEKLRAASTALSASNATLPERVTSTIPEMRKDAPEPSETLIERYRGLPGVGEWASTEESSV
ncbi:hypothetical protein [Metapseudomonas otitidis]|uniref:hypothetical protein n=1 Tax=Metapseudomonas otitidis TaxID=319939 RepID=UPI0013F66F9E|nr:hypothetical protein [Pseudomonas otitidis]